MKNNPLVFYSTAFSILLVDQLTKAWIRSNLAIGETLAEWGFIRIIRIPPNTGAAFGMFRQYPLALAAFSTVSAIAIIICAAYLWRRYPRMNTNLTQLMLGLVLGGTLGNLVDRLQPRLGGVTDFISIGPWPSFNVADSAIVVGILVFVYYLLHLMQEGKI